MVDDDLEQALLNFIKEKEWLILCLGNELKADDSIGIFIGNSLLEHHPELSEKVIIAYNVPASFLGKIVKVNPERILAIDAAAFGENPGVIGLFDTDIIQEKSNTTHFQEYETILKFLQMETGHEIFCKVLAIQVQTTELVAPISDPVKSAADKVINILSSILMKNDI